MIAGWPVAKRAALLVVAPVLNFDMAAVTSAFRAGTGGLLFLGSTSAPAALGGELTSALQNGPAVHPLVMADQEGGGVQRLAGVVTSLPWARQMAQTMTTSQVQQLAKEVGSEMKALGVTVDLAPVLDVDGGDGPNATDADGLRSFSPVASVAAGYGVAFYRGLTAAGELAVVKHFPGLGGSSGNTDYQLAQTPPLSTLEKVGLLPFRDAISAGARAVMVSNAAVPGLTTKPASLSHAAITGLLRTSLGFHGLVLTDSLSAGAIAQAGYSVPRAAVAAISAGADMVLFGSTLTPAQVSLLAPQEVVKTVQDITSAIVAATSNGTLPISRLDDAVGHVLSAGGVNLCG